MRNDIPCDHHGTRASRVLHPSFTYRWHQALEHICISISVFARKEKADRYFACV